MIFFYRKQFLLLDIFLFITFVLFSQNIFALNSNKKFKTKALDFKSKKLIGSGTYKDVYKVPFKNDKNKFVALLKAKEGKEKTFDKEIEFYKKYSHPNIMTVYHLNNKKHEIIAEYGPNTLKKWIDSQRLIGKDELYSLEHLLKKLDILIEILNVVVYLHQNNIIHCDLKPENILVDENESAKIIDFGSSQIIPQGSSFVKGDSTGGTMGFLDISLYGLIGKDENSKKFVCKSLGNDIYSISMIIFYVIYEKEYLRLFKKYLTEEEHKSVEDKDDLKYYMKKYLLLEKWKLNLEKIIFLYQSFHKSIKIKINNLIKKTSGFIFDRPSALEVLKELNNIRDSVQQNIDDNKEISDFSLSVEEP